ncbi:peptide-methionine (S)-S-oxide reductase MsrA [Rheinheimera texasensis]|uniref:peptide-methionine (S)-S-oxide reductase MsrA n=1 Tax=Rheinheimera texasensis TaxID=306205 RepID=UPI0032B29794
MAQLATFAGGCFWCIEAALARVQGVSQVVSGYMGGSSATANYRAVCTGSTGHAEVVQLQFDPAQVSFELLLQMFFQLHDPTTLNRQGNDVGTQYRSEIFVHDETQLQVAQRFIADKQPEYSAPIVTAISRASTFYPAEAYHQDYFSQNPDQPYCAYLIAPKLAKFRQTFAAALGESDITAELQ